jgi:hypothetical protein
MRREIAMRVKPRDERGFIITIKVQTIVIVGVVALLGLVVIPVWMSRAAGPQEVTLATNVDTVAKLYAIALLEGPASPLISPGPETAGALGAHLQRPVTNPLTRSSAIVAGDDWPGHGEAPGVWITTRPEGAPAALAKQMQMWNALAGTVIVYVGPSLEIDVFAVSTSGGELESMEHLSGS